MDKLLKNAEQVTDKESALELLQEMADKLAAYGELAQDLVSEYFPDHLEHTKAYGTFDFGRSNARDDHTLAVLIYDLDEEIA